MLLCQNQNKFMDITHIVRRVGEREIEVKYNNSHKKFYFKYKTEKSDEEIISFTDSVFNEINKKYNENTSIWKLIIIRCDHGKLSLIDLFDVEPIEKIV